MKAVNQVLIVKMLSVAHFESNQALLEVLNFNLKGNNIS